MATSNDPTPVLDAQKPFSEAATLPGKEAQAESARAENVSADPPAPDAALSLELEATRRALLAARRELESTRLELKRAKGQLQLIGESASPNFSEQRGRELRRVLELEKLGKRILEQNAHASSTLEAIVHDYLAGVVKIHPGMRCTCMHLKGDKLYLVASSNMPKDYLALLRGISIGPEEGSCGSAAYWRQKVIVQDIAHDPRWAQHKESALAYGLRACWSFPVLRTNQEVMGTMAVFYDEPRMPSPQEEASLSNVSKLLQLLMENKLADQALRESNDRFYYATLATHDAIYDWNVENEQILWGIGFEKIFGVARTPETSTQAYWESRIHPVERQETLASLQGAMEDPTQEVWQAEYRYLKADGVTTGYISERGFIIRNAERVPVRMVGALEDISARKEAEEELRKLSVIAKETLHGVLIMEPDQAIRWVNPSFTKILGYSLDEVKGKRPGSFLNGEETDPKTLAYIREKMERREPLMCELLQYAKSGKKCWLRVQAQPLLNPQGELESFFAFITDITRQQKEDQKLRLLESVITNAHEAILVSRIYPRSQLKPRNTFCNKAFLELSGYQQEDVIGKQPLLLHGPDTDAATLASLHTAIAQVKACDLEWQAYRKNGDKFWAHVSAVPIFDKQRKLTHWIFMMRDITVRKHYEQERELLISELTQNNADLKQFSFIASHNLRAPLSNLKGIVNLLDLDSVPEGRNKVLIQKFSESTLQLSTIIDDLLEILVIKNGVQIKEEQLSLEEAFQKVKASVDGLLAETGAHVLTDFSAAPVVPFNPGYLHSILLNLLTNAIKYRSPERPLEIQITTAVLGGIPQLNFTDNGLGIDLERYRDRIFGLYQRFHQHKDSKGMGLYIAQSQAKAMGGQLLVQSQVNQGTTFTLQFRSIKEG